MWNFCQKGILYRFKNKSILLCHKNFASCKTSSKYWPWSIHIVLKIIILIFAHLSVFILFSFHTDFVDFASCPFFCTLIIKNFTACFNCSEFWQPMRSLLSFYCWFFCYTNYRWRYRACGPFVIKWWHLI